MGFLDEIWWCSGPLGPFDDKVPDVTSCFQYTAILIPVSLLFIMAAAVQYGCCPHCADIASQSIYERLLAEDQIDSSASSVRSHMSRRPSRARFTRLCTSRSRPLWIALGAMCMFPFAEILIRFLLGTLLDGAVYPYVSIITEEFLRSLAYVISAWCLSATSHIPGLVRFFWCAEALATAKEIESGVLRLGTDRDDNMLVVHCLKMLFSIVLVFYAVRPSIVGEGDMLWPGLEEEDEVKTSATNSIREGGHQPWLVSGQGSITGSRPETLTRDVARPRVADSVWDAFLEPSTPPKNTDPEMGDLGGGSDNKTNPSFMAASAVSDGYADSKGSSAPRTPGSSAGRTPQNGRMDLSEVQVSVTTWLLRSKKNSKREEVNYCVLVRVPEAIYERMGAEATTYRIWRSWPRFQLLDRQIRRVTGTQSRHPPFPDRYASRSHHSSADLLEQDRANLDSYMNKLLREPRYWPAVLRFLQKGTEKIARPVGLPFLKPGGLAPQAAAAAPAPLEDSQTPPSEQAAAFGKKSRANALLSTSSCPFSLSFSFFLFLSLSFSFFLSLQL